MHKQRLLSQRPSFLISGFISLSLLVGVFVFVMQAQLEQNVRSNAASGNDCTISNAQIASSAAEQDLFTKINVYRKAQGRPELVWAPNLEKPAAWMSNDMLTHDNLSHTDSLGRDLASRLIDCGVVGVGSFGENIDSGTINPDSILESWKHASGQNANLLNPAFTKAAVSLATDTTTQAFWVLNLASNAPVSTPTSTPSATATKAPSPSPTSKPTTPVTPSVNPTATKIPTAIPTKVPTKVPTAVPTKRLTPTNTPKPTRIPTPTIDPKFVVNPDDTQIGLSVKIPGVGEGGNSVPKNLSRKIQIDVYNQENDLVKSGTGFLIYDNGFFRGIIHLGQLPNDTYYLKVFGPNTLQMTVEPVFQQIRNDRLNILPNVYLLAGDLDTNNILNLEDYAVALACFQDKKCETIESIDFNDDGKTDITDYNILLQSFWRFQGD